MCLCVVADNSQSVLARERRNARTCKNIELARCMVNNEHFVHQFQDNNTLSLSTGQRLLYCSLISKPSIFKMGISKIYGKIFLNFNCT